MLREEGKDMKAPTNTTKKAAVDPWSVIIDAMFEDRPGGAIEAQEHRQQELVQSDTLPKDCRPSGLAALGITVIGPVPGDDLFQFVKLPEGWKKRRRRSGCEASRDTRYSSRHEL